MRRNPLALGGLGEIVDAYDAFIIDQWGVLHDGCKPYPGAIDCLERLRARGRPTIVLSNSPKRADRNLARMAAIGIAPALVTAVISSGEAFHRDMTARPTPFFAGLGRRCFVIAEDADRSPLEGLDLAEVGRIEDADFVLVTGLDSPRVTVAGLEALLAAARARELPMICANPDILRITPGGVFEAPGAVARRYEAMGGRVCWFGKPHPAIYDVCFAAIGGRDDRRFLAIGDSLDHDVRGAGGVGGDAVLIAGGVLASELRLQADGSFDAERLRALCAEADAWPKFVMPDLRW